jgi:hypothetical protein
MINIIPYIQTSKFTCGPASLLTTFMLLDSNAKFTREDEYAIWHEANSIFMGNGHPGCSCYGLALSAMKRGYTVKIGINTKIDNLLFLDCLKGDTEVKIHAWKEQLFRNSYLDNNGVEEPIKAIVPYIRNKLSKGYIVICLITSTKNNLDGHWIVVYKIDGMYISYYDPYVSGDITNYENNIHIDNFVNIASYGKLGKKACISIRV